jgi:hypothetical protein
MTLPGNPPWGSRRELLARAAVGMPAFHPERITCRPSRGEWKQLARWLAEMWPNDEYTAIIAHESRKHWPPKTQGWR